MKATTFFLIFIAIVIIGWFWAIEAHADWHRPGGHGGNFGHRSWGGGGWHRGPGAGDIAGGIIGGMIGGWLASPPPPPPPPEPEPPAIEPWTQPWYDYCNGAYKSFDAKTGYWTGFDGQQHFCVAQ